VLRRAGLLRNQQVPPQGSIVTVPDRAVLQRLKEAVVFKIDDLRSLFRGAGASVDDVEAMTAGIGDVPLRPGPWESQHLTLRPLARSGASIVVVAPHLLVQAALRTIVSYAMNAGAHEAFATALHDAARASVGQSLERLRHHRSGSLRGDPSECKRSRVSHELWQFDEDKLLHVAVISDALEPGHASGPVGVWDTSEIPDALPEARSFFEALVQSEHAPQCLLTLVICAGAGRDYAVEKPTKSMGETPPLFLLASELEIISLTEDEADSLLLWKFACARHDFERTSEISAWSTLDIYGWWKRRGRRFLVAKDPTFSDWLIHPGSGAEELRIAAVRRYDWHAVPHPNGALVEVGLVDGMGPIYAPRQRSRDRFELVLDTHGVTTWLVSMPVPSADRAGREIYVQFARAIGYWVCEFARALPKPFQEMSLQSVPVLIELDIGSSDAWLSLRTDDDEPDGPCFSVRQDSKSRITVTVEPAFLRRYTESGNTAEGELAVAVVSALLNTGLEPASAKAAVDSVRAKVVPPGPKRMLHQVDSRRRPELLPTARMSPRHLQQFDAVRAHTATLAALRRSLGAAEGKWAGDRTKAALKAAVASHFDDLRRSVGSIEISAALRYVMARSEALLADRSRRRDTLASQLACYADDAGVIERLREQLPANAQASLATRFLIELIAAEAPVGTDRISDALFDQWLATACEIIALGTACDLQHLALADVQIALHPNGYEISRGTYGEAALAVQEASVAQAVEIVSGEDSTFVPSAWPFPKTEEIDRAAEAEFGCSLTGIDRLLSHVSHIAGEHDESVVEMPQQVLVSKLSSQLSWDPHKVRAVLETLILEKRSEFTKPSAPYSPSDVLPWRFNRALSYLRRPLIRAARAERLSVYFAAGAPTAAAEHLIELCMQGRIKARSAELRRVMSHFSEAFGMVFNAHVAETLKRNGFWVRMNVRKVGHTRLTLNDNDLGDIDVLAVDRYRKRLWVIECKNFAAARVPHEVKHDLEDLFIDSARRTSVQTKHQRRVEWVSGHVAEILGWLRIPAQGRWKVCAGLVFSQALISPLLGHARMPIWTATELRDGGGPGVVRRRAL
jgi:hypothetical protein